MFLNGNLNIKNRLTLVFFLVLSNGSHSPVWCTESLDIGQGRQLFFDHKFIASSEGVEIVMNQPVKVGPVLKPDRPWEVFRLTSYFTVIEDQGLYRMYYSCFSKDQWHTPDAWENHAYLCYAESHDGVTWTKPDLGIIEFEGSKNNNIILRSVVDGTVFIDPQAAPEKRYKLLHTIGPHKEGLRVSYSSDGIHFTIPETQVSAWTPDSQQNAFWDYRLKKYVAYLRTNMSLGYDQENAWRKVVRIELDDIEQAWPTDKPPVVFSPDESDPPEVDFYTNCCFQYPWAEDAYFMFPAAYHHYAPEMGNDGLLDVSAACSRDGIHWERPDRGPYVPLGKIPEWDCRFISMGVGVLRHENDLFQYYSGIDQSHGGTRRMAEMERSQFRQRGWIGCTRQRLDGFYSADFAYSGGHLSTPPLRFKGDRLVLNINTSSAGSAYVAVLDEAGNPIPGFGIQDCEKIMTNSVNHLVRWKNGPDLAALNDRVIRLQIEARSAKLYALQFLDGALHETD